MEDFFEFTLMLLPYLIIDLFILNFDITLVMWFLIIHI